MSENTTPRLTVSTLAQIVAQQGEQISQILALMTAHSTPAPVVTAIENAPSKRQQAGTKDGVKVVSLKTAQKRVDAGEDAWKISVRSSNGNVVPFGVVLRATKASERKTTKVADAPKATRTNANPYFAMSKADLVADGSTGAKNELARREAKRASKTA